MKRALASAKPTKMWIDGVCFDIRTPSKRQKPPESANSKSESGAAGDTAPAPEGSQVVYDIARNDEGKPFTAFRVPEQYTEKLGRLDFRAVESRTKTSLSIPGWRAKDAPVVITGETYEGVMEARDEVQSALSEIRDHSSALQFVSIPTRSEEIMANFNKFKEDLLNGDPIKGLEESVFQSALKLHLTIVVFSLLSKNEVEEAVKALQECKSKIFEQSVKDVPLEIALSGVHCMTDDPKKAHILYSGAELTDNSVSLQKLVNEVSDHFYEKGLVTRYQDNVKLHMTLINTKYRNTRASPKKRWAKRISFDASTIIEKYKDYSFGKCALDSLHLNLISSVGDDGFYKSLSIVKL